MDRQEEGDERAAVEKSEREREREGKGEREREKEKERTVETEEATIKMKNDVLADIPATISLTLLGSYMPPLRASKQLLLYDPPPPSELLVIF